MAYQKYNGYQYETSPRKLQPEYEPQINPYKQKKTTTRKVNKNSTKKVTKSKLKPRSKALLYLIIGFSTLFAISYRNSLITENFNQKENLKKNLSSIQKENEQVRISIENSLNLNNVEQSAKEMLGMHKLDNSQKVYISLQKKDYIEPATEEVVIDEDVNLFQKLLNGFKKISK